MTGTVISTDGPTLVLSGDFDVRSTGDVRNAIYEQLRDHPGDLVIDISEVDTVDLTALRVIGAASRHASRHGRRLRLRGACPAVRRMLHLTHLIRVVELERESVPA
ncbi:MAG TPA: STAS domain-containing protein [Nocardioides sp.]|nr:STAS domain-containing protein [Nocardioides sp.]